MRVVKTMLCLLALFPCLSLTAFAQPTENTLPKTLETRAMKIVAELVEESFPELVDIKLTPKAINNPSVFLATDIDALSILSGDREYTLYLNQKLMTQPISDLALKGILAHELVHFNDYEKMNAFELAVFYVRILADARFEAEYERATDLQSFERGYAIGIKAFRFWLYDQITPKAKALKEINYYTPAEIDEWLLSQNEVTLL